MNFKSILWSLDLWAAAGVTLIAAILLPRWIKTDFAKDVYGVAIGVLSILFSVFFAALAIIMASSDDEFVRFLEKESDYTGIVASMKFTLITLFTALVAALFLYSYTSFRSSLKIESQHYAWLAGFAFLFAYALAASLAATLDAIKYSNYRTKFLNIISDNPKR